MITWAWEFEASLGRQWCPVSKKKTRKRYLVSDHSEVRSLGRSNTFFCDPAVGLPLTLFKEGCKQCQGQYCPSTTLLFRILILPQHGTVQLLSEWLFPATVGLRLATGGGSRSREVRCYQCGTLCVFASSPRSSEQPRSPWKAWNSNWWSSTILSHFSEPESTMKASLPASHRSTKSRCHPYRRIWTLP